MKEGDLYGRPYKVLKFQAMNRITRDLCNDFLPRQKIVSGISKEIDYMFSYITNTPKTDPKYIQVQKLIFRLEVDLVKFRLRNDPKEKQSSYQLEKEIERLTSEFKELYRNEIKNEVLKERIQND